MRRLKDGIPFEEFAPSPYGPPLSLAGQPIPTRINADNREGSPQAQKIIIGYRPVTLTAPLPPRRRRAIFLTVLPILSLLLLVGVLVALMRQTTLLGQSGQLGNHSGHSTALSQATATRIAACVATLNPTAAAMLSQVQLTSGLRDSAHHDDRPVNAVSSFRANTQGYITFQIATAQAGTVAVRFCLPSRIIVGALAVPAGSQHRYGEFTLLLAAGDIGQSQAILTWNGNVAAIVAFIVQAA